MSKEKYNPFPLYMNEETTEIMEEVKALAKECNLSIQSVLWGSIRLCLPLFQKELKNKRTIEMNGVKVVI